MVNCVLVHHSCPTRTPVCHPFAANVHLVPVQGINEMQAAGNLLGSASSGVQLQYAIVDRALGHLTDLVQGFVAHVNGLIDSSGAPLPAVDPSPEEEGLPEQSMSLAPRQSRRARDRAKEVADESAATRGRCDAAHGCV